MAQKGQKMREIKFRAWDVKQKQMFWWNVLWGNHRRGDGYIGMVTWGEKQTHHMHRDNMRLVDPDDCEIMQFTGLHDKNGKEIYEGDILKSETMRTLMTVKWWDGCAGFNLAWIQGHNITVIGNIYENTD